MVGYVIGKDGSRGEAQEAHLDEDPPFVANSLTYVLVFNFQLASGPRQTTQDALKDRVQSCVGDVRARRLEDLVYIHELVILCKGQVFAQS